MTRPVAEPKKYKDFVDGRIPAEYLEDEFLLFEDYMLFTQNTRESTRENPHANGDYVLQKFKEFEKFTKSQSRMRASIDPVSNHVCHVCFPSHCYNHV